MPIIHRDTATHKKGDRVSFSEAAKLFSSAVKNITPLQQAKTERTGLWISTIGVLLGIIVLSVFSWKQSWWLIIILVGGLIISLVQLIGNAQKIKMLKHIELMTAGISPGSDNLPTGENMSQQPEQMPEKAIIKVPHG